MDFTQEILANRRALLDDIDRRIEEALRPFADALEMFLAILFQGRLPVDWREQWHAFVADQATKDFFVEPQSVRDLEDWIEAWAGFCGLLPLVGETNQSQQLRERPLVSDVAFEGSATVAVPGAHPAGDQDSPFRLAGFESRSGGTSPPSTEPATPQPQPRFNDQGVEVAGPGPETTKSYRTKVQKSLEILDPRVAIWWRANSVQGQVRSRAAGFWQSSYYSLLEANEQPIVVVDQSFIAGQTAQAIIAEVTTGWFANSIGAFYKKYQISKTLNPEEFRQWQKNATGEAARQASILAELYINSIATLTPGGDLAVTLGDLAENGPRWDQLVSVLPLLGMLPIGAVIVEAGKRRFKISNRAAQKLGKLPVDQRTSILDAAANAKTDGEAAAIIEHGVQFGQGPQHHIATNKNWISGSRGGPWTPRFEKLFEKAGMTLDDAVNRVRVLGHKGPHSEKYHQEVFKLLSDATRGKKGKDYKVALLDELQRIAHQVVTLGTKLNRLLMEP